MKLRWLAFHGRPTVSLLRLLAVSCLGLSDPGHADESLTLEAARPLPSYNGVRLIDGTGSADRGFYPTFVVGDFNKDGRPDVVVLDGRDGTQAELELGVSAYLQHTNGTFALRGANRLYTGYTTELIAGDFNGDGHLDLVANNLGYDLLMLVGHGDGTFDDPHYLGLEAPLFPVTADLNHDRLPDLVVGALDGTVKVFSGAGDGTFTVAASLNTVISQSPRRGQILIGDVNGDGKPDVVVGSVRDTSTRSGNLDVFFGKGDATFQPVISTVNVGVWRGALGDFNSDGVLDFAGDRFGPGQLEIWLGKGDGTFGKNAAYGLSGNPAYVQAGDLNTDGICDLVVAAETVGGSPAAPLCIFLGKGDGTFQPRQLWSPLPGYDIFNLGPQLMDFDGDGLLDILTIGAAPAGSGNPLILDRHPGVKADAKAGFLIKVPCLTTNRIVLESSPDLIHWVPLATNAVPAGLWPIVDPTIDVPVRFYRSRK